jgi:hypothetical protein
VIDPFGDGVGALPRKIDDLSSTASLAAAGDF